ncbi:arsenate reductase-like glutaredoxin family protein [Bradyrhizobium sp. BR13661]|jgi:arsenate reductase|nr:arsenate reductase-like glutaredoxin family protein [Bradyrhizobium sp. BR13661]
MDAIITHNPECGASRTTLAAIGNAGIEPRVIERQHRPG